MSKNCKNCDIDSGYKKFMRSIKQCGKEVSLSFEEYKYLRKRPCFWCGGEIWNIIGLDRLDNKKGYNLSNCVPSCGMCNILRAGYNIKSFMTSVVKVYEHLSRMGFIKNGKRVRLDSVEAVEAVHKFFKDVGVFINLRRFEQDAVESSIASGLRNKKLKGEHVGSEPLGFRRKGKYLVKLVEETKLIEYIKQLRRRGHSLRSICKKLNDSGKKTKRGGAWYPGTVRYILNSSRYKRKKEHTNKEE